MAADHLENPVAGFQSTLTYLDESGFHRWLAARKIEAACSRIL